LPAKAQHSQRHSQKNGGLEEFGRRLEKAKRRRGYKVKVGLPTGSADYPDGTSVIMVGTIHEFGSSDGTIPERSFLRSAMETHKREHQKMIRKLAEAVSSGKQSPEKAMALLGTKAAADVSRMVTDLSSPPNRPATIAAKGRANPLVDTGHLVQSITYQVIGKSS
jgi:hypothetical protein